MPHDKINHNCLNDFLQTWRSEAFIHDLARLSGTPEKIFRLYYDAFINESFIALDLVLPYLDKKARILEIGSGLPFFSMYLRREGYDITALEPAQLSFGFLNRAIPKIQKKKPDIDLPMITLGAEDLDPAVHGKFDLIFSLNVIEHMQNIESSFSAMKNVLTKDGTMIHSCPNYAFPYEPHFGILLPPLFPQAGKYIARERISAHQAVWDSLNFISYRKIVKLARQNQMQLSFQKRTFYDAVYRLLNDKEFSRRHVLFARIATKIAKTPLLELLRFIPAAFATPMTFTARHKKGQELYTNGHIP